MTGRTAEGAAPPQAEAGRLLGYVLKRFPRISETFVAGEILELERQGEHITIFAVSRPDEPFTHAFLAGLRAQVVYLPHRPIRQPRRVARAVGRSLRARPGDWCRTAVRSAWPPRRAGIRRFLQACVLREEMAEAGITHCHAHFATAAARLAHLAWRLGGPSYSVTAHAKDIWHRQVRPDRLREKLCPATFVATVSEVNRAYLAEVLGPGSGPVVVVPNGVDSDLLPVRHAPVPALVVTVARLVEKKGIGDLVQACAILRTRSGIAVSLEVVGDGPLRAELEEAAAAASVDADFVSARPHDDVMARVARASVFCLPAVVAGTGDRDGMPTAVLEAMAMGVPVVTTAVNGLSEAVCDEETGLVVPEHDPAAIAGALQRLLTDEALAARLARAGRRRVEERYLRSDSAAQLGRLFPGGAASVVESGTPRTAAAG